MNHDDEGILDAIHDWRPTETEFVVLTAADWRRIQAHFDRCERDALLDDIELVPVTLELPTEWEPED